MTFDSRDYSKLVEIFTFSCYQEPAGKHSGKLSNKNLLYVFNVIDWAFGRSWAACIQNEERVWLCRQNCLESKSAFHEFLKIRFLSTEANWEKCLYRSSSIGSKYSIEIKLFEVKPAFLEKVEVEHQDVSKFTFLLGLWKFSDFDAGIKFIGLRSPFNFFWFNFVSWDLDELKRAGTYGETWWLKEINQNLWWFLHLWTNGTLLESI